MYDNHEFFRSWFSDFAEEEGISYYDFNLYRWKFGLLPDQDCFGDDTHLNDLGAERFSEYLAQFLTERDAGADMSYYFFSTYAVRDEVFGYVS